MIETGITINDVPLEDHLKDKKRERFFKSLEADIKEKKELIYQTGKTRCLQHHDTRPGKCLSISKEEYMKDKHTSLPASAGEAILAMMTTGGWWTVKMMHDANPNYGMRAYAQAAITLLERFKGFVLKKKIDGRRIGYSLPYCCVFSVEDMLKLYRKNITLQYLEDKIPVFKSWMNRGPKAKPEPKAKANICFSLEQASIEICKLQKQIAEITDHLARAEMKIDYLGGQPPAELTKVEDGGVTVNIYTMPKG